MTIRNDRVGELLEGSARRSKIIVSPEGVPVLVHIAGCGERLTAFFLDIALLGVTILTLYLILFLSLFSGTNFLVSMTLILFIAFVVRNLYFLHFELAWQGRTPGKKICGLRVISRDGGRLTPAAVIARNLTREVEFFLPLSLFLSLDATLNPWQQITLLGWLLCITALPLFNKERLRAGDLIGGTQVIAMPKRVLLPDLSETPRAKEAGVQQNTYAFTRAQLAIYGAFELQVLEEVLRRPPSEETERLLYEICGKIRRKIGWEGNVAAKDARRFLSAFYTAERDSLEHEQIMGRFKADKTASP